MNIIDVANTLSFYIGNYTYLLKCYDWDSTTIENTPEHFKWIRLNARLVIVQYQTLHILYLKGKYNGSI